MPAEFELNDLSHGRSKPITDNDSQPLVTAQQEAPTDSVISLWAWISSGLLLLLSLCLTLFPRFLLFASETSTERRVSLTPLEAFLALHSGIWLFAIAVSLMLNIPSSHQLPIAQHVQNAPPGHPLLAPLTGASILTSFISYNTTQVGPLAFIVFLGSGVIGAWGLWAIIFAGSSRISNKTGADKRTSAFLFGNKSAASKQKKEWKKEQKYQ